jgi:hypothetical protein
MYDLTASDDLRLFEFTIHLTGAETPALTARSGAATPAGRRSRQQRDDGAAAASDDDDADKTISYSHGRPDTDALLARVQAQQPGRSVGVFFCGPATLGQRLKRGCRRLNAAARAERARGDVECSGGGAGGGGGVKPCRLDFRQEIF